MPKPIILLADNDDDFRKTLTEFLEQEGYHIIQATNPTEARQRVEAGGIDLAILDIRLENEDDERDLSGLWLAKEMAEKVPTIVTSGFMEQMIPMIPKIILTGFPSYENVREALAPRVGGLPAAVDFVAKQEGPEVLLAAVRRALSASERRQAEIPVAPAAMMAEVPGIRVQAQRKTWILIGAFASLILGTAMGFGAVVTGNPWLLLGALFFIVLLVVGLVVGTSME